MQQWVGPLPVMCWELGVHRALPWVLGDGKDPEKLQESTWTQFLSCDAAMLCSSYDCFKMNELINEQWEEIK